MDKLEVHYNRGYTAMSNHHLRDTSISWQAMGVLSFMLSCREDFKFSIEGLTKCSSCGETATRSALKELREHGYIKISRLIGEGGKVVGWKYDVFENPDVENPDVECQGQSNTNKRITNIKTPNNPTLFDNKDSVISPKGDRSKDIEERRAKFHESLRPYIQQYGEDLIIAFYNYWVEKNPKGTKMRFEMEKTFEISRRLSTWKRNDEERKFRRR